MLVTMRLCSRLPPLMATISPSAYSLRNSARRSNARYSSGFRFVFRSEDIAGTIAQARNENARQSGGATSETVVNRTEIIWSPFLEQTVFDSIECVTRAL